MEEDIKCLDLLLEEYEDRTASTGSWVDSIKAHGIANYLLALGPTEERWRQVYGVEKRWYKDRHPLSYDEHQVLTTNHKQLLIDYREVTILDFDSLREKGESVDIASMFSDEAIFNSQAFADNIFKMSKKCSDGFIDVSRSIIESSVEILSSIGLKPPCPFAVIGLGSVARGEATPYSDLEYAFIVEDDTDVEYFMKLAIDSYFRVDNIGESPLKTFNVRWKANSKREICLPPVGFRIDGLTPNAGNIPTGNGESQVLILTVEKLMKIYDGEVISPTGELAPLSDLLSTSVIIYSNQGGRRLHEKFLSDRLRYEDDNGQGLSVKEKRLHTMSQDIERYNFLPNFTFGIPANIDLKVKVDIFRYPTLLATNLNIIMNLDSHYPWDTYAIVHQLGILTQENLRYLNIVLGLSIYIRTSAYLAMQTQADHLSLYTSSIVSKLNADRYYVPKNIFVTLGCLLVPIKNSILTSLRHRSSQIPDLGTVDIVQYFRSLVKDFKISKMDYMLKAEVLFFAGDNEGALAHISSMIGETVVQNSAKFIEAIRHKYQTQSSKLLEKKYVCVCSSLLYNTGQYASAIQYIRTLIAHYSTSQLHTVEWKILMARCMNGLRYHNTAKTLLDQVILTLRNDLGLDTQQPLHEYVIHRLQSVSQESSDALDRFIFRSKLTEHTYNDLGRTFCFLHKFSLSAESYHASLSIKELMVENGWSREANREADIAAAFDKLGTVYTQMSNYRTALEYHTKACNMMQTLYGRDTNHKDRAINYCNIGMVYRHMCIYTKSLEYHIKAMNMEKALYGNDADHADIAFNHDCIGDVYNDMGDYTNSLKYHNISLTMRRGVYGKYTNHPDIALSYSNTGIACAHLGDAKTAMEYHTKAFNMRQALYAGQINHPDIAQSYHNLAYLYEKCGNLSKSLEYNKISLKMRKALHGEHTANRVTANSYNAVGLLHQKMGDYATSLEYCNKALAMQMTVHGESADNPDIARSYTNIGMTYYKMRECTTSLEYYTKALAMFQATSMNRHHIATVYSIMADAYEGIREYTCALEYYNKSVDMWKALFGGQTPHAGLATTYNGIGIVYYGMKAYTAALEYFTKSLDMRKALHGEHVNHAAVASLYHNIAAAYHGMGDSRNCQVYLTKSKVMRRALSGESDQSRS